MPVSTRSQISGGGRDDQEGGSAALRNPHQGLKEKLRALTLLYEQHRQPAARMVPTHHPSVELADSTRKKRGQEHPEDEQRGERRGAGGAEAPVMRENLVPPASPAKPARRPLVFPRADAKENYETDDGPGRIAVYSCPKKVTVTAAVAPARRLSAGSQSEGRAVLRAKKTNGDLGAISEDGDAGGSRILVFVRLRPMAKREREAGSRCCVKIVNRRDVYLTEFASETDYLRLKRLRGRHFCFDAAFPDSTTQQEVYTTT